MPLSLDRHGRGLRGPMASANDYGVTARPPRRLPRAAHFEVSLRRALARVQRHCPQALVGTRVGVADVPDLPPGATGEDIPLASAVQRAGREAGAQIVLYRRPMEHRAAGREELSVLVMRALVEQLSAVTGLDPDDIDPEGFGLRD